MNSLIRTLSRCVAMFLVCALLATPMANASTKPLTSEQAHARIHKLGAGSWVGVRLQSGVAFSGKITSIDEHSFSLQRYGDPNFTPVAYDDVAYLENALSMGSFSGKPLTAEMVHARLLKRGLGNWVAVELENGVEFCGRLLSVDENSFGVQLYGDPEETPVAYSDVVYLQAGLTNGQKAVLIALPAAGAAAMIGGIVAFHNNEPKPLTLPSTPNQPIFPVY